MELSTLRIYLLYLEGSVKYKYGVAESCFFVNNWNMAGSKQANVIDNIVTGPQILPQVCRGYVLHKELHLC